MIFICPFCGSRLSKPLTDGITTCDHCDRIFDSSSKYKILSAAWWIRKNNIWDITAVSAAFELDQKESELVDELIINQELSHDEFIQIVKQKLNLKKI